MGGGEKNNPARFPKLRRKFHRTYASKNRGLFISSKFALRQAFGG
jgi:hypothetical protein